MGGGGWPEREQDWQEVEVPGTQPDSTHNLWPIYEGENMSRSSRLLKILFFLQYVIFFFKGGRTGWVFWFLVQLCSFVVIVICCVWGKKACIEYFSMSTRLFFFVFQPSPNSLFYFCFSSFSFLSPRQQQSHLLSTTLHIIIDWHNYVV